jgi:hypothetical protein
MTNDEKGTDIDVLGQPDALDENEEKLKEIKIGNVVVQYQRDGRHLRLVSVSGGDYEITCSVAELCALAALLKAYTRRTS